MEMINLEDKDLQPLFLNLGVDVTNSQSLGAINLNPKKLTEIGKKWFVDNFASIKNVTCSSKLAQIVTNQDDIKNRLAVAFGDLLMDIITGISPVTLAAIVLEIGINKICKEKIKKENPAHNKA